MKAPCSGSQARALLPIYMVAGSYWCPMGEDLRVAPCVDTGTLVSMLR
jgi:hypothetical protein